MFEKTNLELLLRKQRTKRLSGRDILKEVNLIFSENETARTLIEQELTKGRNNNAENLFDFDLLESDRIFHIEDIKDMCFNYRLRFLDSRFFKAEFPEEAITKIRQLEKEHNITIEGLKVMAPAKLLKLENADDPLLFAPMGNDYFYLIHKWGNDLHPMRKLFMWPYKSFENLVFTIFICCILLTMMMPMGLFSNTQNIQEYALLFLFIFKGVAGMALFYGFAKGKNFSTAIWDSKFYNA